MIEVGIVLLVNNALEILTLADNAPDSTRGTFAELPKDQGLPSWSYKVISEKSDTGLGFSTGLAFRRLQIDCFGASGNDAIVLAGQISAVLNGFQGNLPDPDSTYVSSCFSSDVMDFVNDAPRCFRRMLEFEIWYANSQPAS